jgi:tRNA(Ile)-lysidine synthase
MEGYVERYRPTFFLQHYLLYCIYIMKEDAHELPNFNSNNTLRDKVLNIIEKYNMIEKGDTIIVGLSGGPDSSVLLHVLYRIKDIYDIKLIAVHLNHMIRGAEADRDEKHAEEFAGSLNVPFISKHFDVIKFSKEKKLSCEEAGRIIRYDFFEETAQTEGASKIALAHNMNDQAETMIMRFIRGSGISGISGIKPVRDFKYIRPLLSCSRHEIEQYCRDFNLNPVVDSTNKETIYLRNKIRLELMPYLIDNFNENLIENLYNMSDVMRDEDGYLNSCAILKIEDIKHKDGYKIDNFNLFHIAVKRRILRLIIEKIKGNLTGIEIKHINECINFIKKAETGKKISLPENLECVIEYDIFKIQKKRYYKDYEYDMMIPGIIEIPEANKIITANLIEKNDKLCKDKEFIKYFDCDKIKFRLKVRNRRDGDYIYPKGMSGRKKLKEIFIDKKIPRDIRDTMPLIAAGKEILCIPCIRDTRNYKVDENSKRILEIKIEGV